jgi:putative membrane protein
VSSRHPGEEGWHRLHPLSPVTRMGRLIPVVVVTFVLSPKSQGGHGRIGLYYTIAIAIIASIFGLVHWLVTRWKFDGDTLRIETGLIRHDSRQLPLARIQAVDVVRPLFARMLGLSELRIRLAGSGSTDGKLAYLTDPAALALRDVLLAGHREAAPVAATEAPVTPMATVATGRLAGSIVFSGLSMILVAAVVTLLIWDDLSPKKAAAAAGVLLLYLVSLASALWRRLSGGYHFKAMEVPEGVRISRGLLQTVSETIPLGRIQAVRRIEPLLWRPFGWCRLEVDIAGAGTRNQRGEGSQMARKYLLPVGTHQDAWHLISRVLGGPAPPLSPPPSRARYKAPLSYHFLAAGHDDSHAVCVTGRLRKVTAWVPLEKSQSIRRVQGPIQRRLGLASVHIDAAGRRVRGVFRDRAVDEADLLVEELTDLSRAARLRHGDAATVRFADAQGGAPAGWYPDPSGRHQLRYWDQGAWTDHVSNEGATAVDQI